MKLTFEPVTNKIDNDYFIVPKNDTEGVKCIMRCNDVGAFIVNLLTTNHNRNEMIAATAEEYPEATPEEIEAAVDGVRQTLKATIKPKPEEGTEE